MEEKCTDKLLTGDDALRPFVHCRHVSNNSICYRGYGLPLRFKKVDEENAFTANDAIEAAPLARMAFEIVIASSVPGCISQSIKISCPSSKCSHEINKINEAHVKSKSFAKSTCERGWFSVRK